MLTLRTVQREGTWSGSPESRPAHIVVQAATPRNDMLADMLAAFSQVARRTPQNQKEEDMKSRILTLIIAMTLFAALAIPLRLAAQGQNQHQPHYTVTDLGTLGGTLLSRAFGLNNKGSVVGYAELADNTDPPPVHAFLW